MQKYEKVCKIKSMQKICQSIQRYEKYLIAQKGYVQFKTRADTEQNHGHPIVSRFLHYFTTLADHSKNVCYWLFSEMVTYLLV